ncbi:MAG: S8 family serine peptidase [Roseiflexaceae bacterium]
MQRTHSIHWPMHWLTMLVLLLSTGTMPVAAERTPTSAAEQILATSPDQIDLTITAGESRTITLQINNTSSSEIIPQIYEAYPSAAAGSVLRQQERKPLRASLPLQAERIDPAIARAAAAAPDQQADFLIFLHQQADLQAATSISNWHARGEWVYQRLTELAEQSQADLRSTLQQRGLRFQPYWIVNAIRVRGSWQDAQALANHQEVAMLRATGVAAIPAPDATTQQESDRCSPDDPGNPICANIRAIQADRVWREFGITGQGITVAINDSGVQASHPALAQNYRGWRTNQPAVHDYNWYDPQGSYREPTDRAGHGTHVLGILAGAGNGTSSQPAIGVAPGAAWIAAQGCESLFCTEGDLIAAAQWLLAPTDLDGQNPRPDLRPMIINNSWGGTGGQIWYAGYIAAWRAAGIFPVFAAGNANASQPAVCRSINSPGDDPNVLAVAASDGFGALAPFSLLGPTSDGRIKPDITAPGTYTAGNIGIYSSYPGDAPYRTLQGTSMATPHVAGVVALLWSANPALIGDYDRTVALLRETAQPLADQRCNPADQQPNNAAGSGRVDALRAVAAATVDVPWLSLGRVSPIAAASQSQLPIYIRTDRLPGPGNYQAQILIYAAGLGSTPQIIPIQISIPPSTQLVTLSGQVRAADSGNPLQTTLGFRGGPTITTDAQGRYELLALPGNYTIEATAPSYQARAIAVELPSAGLSQDIYLDPDQPRLTAQIDSGPYQPTLASSITATLSLHNIGTQPVQYQLFVPNRTLSVQRSDQDGRFADLSEGLLPMPTSALTVTFEASGYAEIPLGMNFPFQGRVFTETLISAHGLIAFDRPIATSEPMTRCLPDYAIYFFLIAPFRADLDPSRGGQVRYAYLPDQQAFVASYEDVPLSDGPLDATYSFQVVLYQQGAIEFRYGELADLPSQLSVGVQRQLNDVQVIGCGTTTPIKPGLTIRFSPQTRPSMWIELPQRSGSISAGESLNLPVGIRWARPELGDLQGEILIVSSDPLQRNRTVPFSMRPTPAAHEVFFPWNRR